MSKIKKYFELEIETPHKWDFEDYLVFLIESLYYIIFPLLIGVIIGLTRKIWLIVFIVMSLFVKFDTSRLNNIRKIKKIPFK